MPSEYHVYLNNLNSSKKYLENNISKFTNDLIPALVFTDPKNWEVGLKSCILPWMGYRTKGFLYGDTFDMLWIIQSEEVDKSVISNHYKIIIHLSSILDKSPAQIVKKIIHESETATEIKNEFFNQIFNHYGDKLAITRYYLNEILKDGAFKNLINVYVLFNENMQDLFGLDRQRYDVFNVNSDRLSISRETIFGSRQIGFELMPSNHIVIYTDIIEPVRYGSQNLSILDILPFGNRELNERKLNEVSYRTVNKLVINDIRILIHGSNHKILKNFAEQMVLLLHFKKKEDNK